MVKMDLKDTYLQVLIHSNHQHLFQFIWEEKHCRLQYLLFNMSSAPWVFLKAVVGLLMFMHANKDQLEAIAPLICKLFKFLGLMINTKMSLLSPTQLVARIFGFSDQFSDDDNHPATREGQEDKAGSNKSAEVPVIISMTSNHIHREGCSNFQSSDASSNHIFEDSGCDKCIKFWCFDPFAIRKPNLHHFFLPSRGIHFTLGDAVSMKAFPTSESMKMWSTLLLNAM